MRRGGVAGLAEGGGRQTGDTARSAIARGGRPRIGIVDQRGFSPAQARPGLLAFSIATFDRATTASMEANSALRKLARPSLSSPFPTEAVLGSGPSVSARTSQAGVVLRSSGRCKFTEH